jgi:hypothetical protein
MAGSNGVVKVKLGELLGEWLFAGGRAAMSSFELAGNSMSMKNMEDRVPSPRELTRADIIRAAQGFRWTRKMPKWTVVVEERELPARTLVLDAAGVPPNDSTNSHQAVAILEKLGFKTRYSSERLRTAERTEEGAASQAGAGVASIVDAFSAIASEVPESEWERVPCDLSKNLDHYLYGAKKIQE